METFKIVLSDGITNLIMEIDADNRQEAIDTLQKYNLDDMEVVAIMKV